MKTMVVRIDLRLGMIPLVDDLDENLGDKLRKLLRWSTKSTGKC